MTENTAINNTLKGLARSYERLDLDNSVEFGWILRLETSLMIHPTHTKKDVFIQHRVFSIMKVTTRPSRGFIKEWLPKAREAARSQISNGKFPSEAYIGGEWQSVEKKFNRWFHWNPSAQKRVGEIQEIIKLN